MCAIREIARSNCMAKSPVSHLIVGLIGLAAGFVLEFAFLVACGMLPIRFVPSASDRHPDVQAADPHAGSFENPSHQIEFPDRDVAVIFTDSGEQIEIRRGAKRENITPPSDCFWAEPVCDANGEFMFVISNRRQAGGYGSDQLYRVRLPARTDAPEDITVDQLFSTAELTHDAFEDLRITDVYAVSDDGRRLLVQVGYVDTSKSEQGHWYFSYRPFFLDVESRALVQVEP